MSQAAALYPFPEERGERFRARRSREERGAGHARRSAGAAGRPLPHSLEAEEMLLACCLIDGAGVICRAREAGIDAGAFYEPKHGLIFARLEAMLQAQLPIDVATLAEEMKSAHELKRVGGFAFLAQVSARVPTTAQAAYFVEKVREQAHLRTIIRSATELVEEAYQFTGDIRGFAAAAKAKLMEVEGFGSRTLPPVMRWAELDAEAVDKPAELVKGVLHQGRRMILAGGSKSFKSWVLLDLAVAVATGTPWWGKETTGGRVLYVNFELPAWGLRDRLRDIARARQGLRESATVPALAEGLEVWDLDGMGADIDALLPHFEARLLRGQYALVILDPIYVCLGERDENSNGDVTQLMNRLAWLARRTGAAVAFGHHFSKGNQAEREAKDRASGAGAWVRAPDTVITLTPHEEEDCFVASFVLRSQPKQAEFVVRWRHPCMEVAKGLNPADLKAPGRPKAATEDDVAKLLGEGECLTYSELMRRAEARGMSASTFKRNLKAAGERGKITQVGSVYKRSGGAS